MYSNQSKLRCPYCGCGNTRDTSNWICSETDISTFNHYFCSDCNNEFGSMTDFAANHGIFHSLAEKIEKKEIIDFDTSVKDYFDSLNLNFDYKGRRSKYYTESYIRSIIGHTYSKKYLSYFKMVLPVQYHPIIEKQLKLLKNSNPALHRIEANLKHAIIPKRHIFRFDEIGYHVKKEEPNKIFGLNLYNAQLDFVPYHFPHLPGLQYLALHYNYLKKIDKSIGVLKLLKFLNLSENQLETLPQEIRKLQNLVDLLVNNNNLANLPDSISELPKLKTISCFNNPKLSLPPEFFKLSLKNIFIDHLQKENSEIRSYCEKIALNGGLVVYIKDNTVENENWWELSNFESRIPYRRKRKGLKFSDDYALLDLPLVNDLLQTSEGYDFKQCDIILDKVTLVPKIINIFTREEYHEQKIEGSILAGTDLLEIKGLGKVWKDKLTKHDVYCVEDLSTATPRNLKNKLGMKSVVKINEIIKSAGEYVNSDTNDIESHYNKKAELSYSMYTLVRSTTRKFSLISHFPETPN